MKIRFNSCSDITLISYKVTEIRLIRVLLETLTP